MAGDRVRDEAERLVAAALAALSTSLRAGNGASGVRDGESAGSTEAPGPGERGFATGSAECCVCPVCRTIAAMRDPNSDLADRLAAGVGDLVSGVTAILRTLSARGGRTEASSEQPATDGDEFWENLRRKAADAAKAYGRPSTEDTSTMDDPWRAATREPEADAEPSAAAEVLVPRPTVATKTVAKKVAKKAVAQRTPADAGAEAVPPQPPAAKAVAKKAVAKRAVKKAVAPGGTA